MKKKVRLTEDQFDNLVKHKILNEAKRDIFRPEWSAEDQILALYNENFGLADVWPGDFGGEGRRRENFANTVLGTTGASLMKNSLNFRWLKTKGTPNPEGLQREIKLQQRIFDEYGSWPRQKLKVKVLDIIDEKINNPDESVLAYREILGQNRVRDAQAQAKKAQKLLHDLDPIRYPYVEDPPKRRYNIRKSEDPELPFKPTTPDPEPEPKPEITEPTTPETEVPSVNTLPPKEAGHEKELVKKYLKSIYDRVQTAKTLEDVKSLSSEIQFIMDYIDMELTDKEQKMVAEMKKFIKNQKILSESIINENVAKIKKIMFK